MKAVRILFLNDNRAHPNWGAQATPNALDAVFDERCRLGTGLVELGLAAVPVPDAPAATAAVDI